MADERPGPDGGACPRADRVVTYEAADRGAVCCLSCQAWGLILVGIAGAVWYLFTAELWKLIAGLILVIGGIALSRYLSTGRNRWEVSFDRDRRIVALSSLIDGELETREIPFDEVESLEMRQIKRDVSTGEGVPHSLPVFVLRSGEEVALNERLSIKDPQRAEEVAREMRGWLSETSDKGGENRAKE